MLPFVRILPFPIRRVLMAGPNDLSGHALLPSGDAKLWIMPAILELFAFPFAWISVQMFHDHELWRAIAGYATTGIVLCVAGVLWAVFRKRIADIWPWRKLRTTKTELVKALADNAKKIVAEHNGAGAFNR